MLNEQHHEYLRLKIYKKIFKKVLKKYVKNTDLKYLLMDSTILNNKYNTELS